MIAINPAIAEIIGCIWVDKVAKKDIIEVVASPSADVSLRFFILEKVVVLLQIHLAVQEFAKVIRQMLCNKIQVYLILQNYS